MNIRKLLFDWRRKKIGPLMLGNEVLLEAAASARVESPDGSLSHFGVPTLGALSLGLSCSVLELCAESVLTLDRTTFGRGTRLSLKKSARLSVGTGTYFADENFLSCSERIEIGGGCAISWQVQIFDDHGHGFQGKPRTVPIRIGDNVWIGARATLLPGTEIGAGSVVAAGSVVKGTFPARSLIAGNPARVVREGISWKI